MMRCLFFALGILLASSLALAQDPVNVDPKHHKVEIDNAQVRVLRVTLGPREKTAVHEHPAGVMICMTSGKLRVSPVGGRPDEDQRTRGDVLLTTAGRHAIENLGDTPIEVIVVELKTPAISSWKGHPLDAVKTDPNNFRVIVENDEVRVLHATAKAPPVVHWHPAYVYVVMSGGSLGSVRYMAGNVEHAPQNEAVTIMVELKTQTGAAAK
jgi:quercetin dioxygenase-like cupin family protein